MNRLTREDVRASGSGDRVSPFRPEALRAYERPADIGAEPLRLDSRWPRRVMWLVVTVLLAAAAFAFIAAEVMGV